MMNFNLFTLDAASTEAANGAAQTPALGGWYPIVMIAIMFLAMYFFLIRPQKKREKAEKAMRDNLQIGDEIITIGGIYGRVVSIKEDTMVIESKSDHSKLTFARSALQQNLTVHDDVASK